MPLKDQIKNFTRKLVETKPGADALADMVHHGKVTSIFFENDGIVPNHPRWPLIVHRASVRFRGDFDPATIIDTLFASNGWGRSWRDTIYNLCIIIRRPTKCSALRAAMPSWSLAAIWKAPEGRRGRHCRPARGHRASPDQGEPELSSRGRLPAIGHL